VAGEAKVAASAIIIWKRTNSIAGRQENKIGSILLHGVRQERRPRRSAVLPGAPRSGLAPWQPEASAETEVWAAAAQPRNAQIYLILKY
jgi:hypothetical protein